ASIHVNGGVVCPRANNLDSGIQSGFGFNFPIDQKFFLSLEFDYWKNAAHEEREKLYNGKLTLTPIWTSLHYDFWRGKNITSYFFIGVGYVFASFKIGEYISIPEVQMNQKVKSGWGYRLGSGVRLKLSRDFCVYGELSYWLRNAEAQTVISDMNLGISTHEFSVHLDAVWIQLGILYYF
ncbi:MAG: hypothetical protein WCC06_06785, partial [Candidatus Aminicenantales bacterium]